ncbi:MAG: hypothetical protein ACYCPD_13305, partial [Acidobacteriaceae bacterium]
QRSYLGEMSSRTAFHSQTPGTLVHGGSFAWYPGFDAPRFSTDDLPRKVERPHSVLDIDNLANGNGASMSAIFQRTKPL